jgi:hypothetical protein
MTAMAWGYAHIGLFILWLGADLGVFLAKAFIKNPDQSFEARERLLARAGNVQVVTRLCFALMLPTGVELIGTANTYPLTPGLRTISWAVSALWLLVILARVALRGKPVAQPLRVLELVFQAFAGLGFVAYGLNSLATGAPIDDPWFATKLFLFGLVFWTDIAVDLCFRAFFAPFSEIGDDGATPEREEAVARAVNQTLVASAVLYALIVAMAYIGLARPV